MNHLLRIGFAVVTILSVVSACERGSTVLPTAPTAPSVTPSPQPTSPVSPNAIPIALGETVTRVVTVSDPPCVTSWGSEPCLRFSVAISTSGTLRVRVTFPGPTGLTLWVNSIPSWGDHEATGTARVQAGGTYEIAVSMHDPQTTSQAFELATSLDPL